jgi:simple sugar transport system substrate-binding protein
MTAASRKTRLAAIAVLAIVPAVALSACSSSSSSSSSSSAAAASDTSAPSAAASTSTSAGNAASGGLADGLGKRSSNRNVTFITYYDPSSDAFWNQMLSGAKDAAQLAGLTLNAQTAGGDVTKMTDLVTAAASTKPAAIFIPFNDPAWENAACDAKKAGIPVFAFNVPPANAAKSCVLAFVGQDFTEVGKIVGARLLQDVPTLKAGDKILCPAEEPTQQYAIQRGGGVNAAIAAKGLKCTFLRTGGDDAPALDALTTWLTANPDVKAVVPLGGTPHRNLVKAEDAATVKAPIVGFDTSPAVIAGIKSGRILATADQQGYIQGFQTVLQSALYLDFAISPSNINSGGNGLIDKTNVANLEATDLKGVRY